MKDSNPWNSDPSKLSGSRENHFPFSQTPQPLPGLYGGDSPGKRAPVLSEWVRQVGTHFET